MVYMHMIYVKSPTVIRDITANTYLSSRALVVPHNKASERGTISILPSIHIIVPRQPINFASGPEVCVRDKKNLIQACEITAETAGVRLPQLINHMCSTSTTRIL